MAVLPGPLPDGRRSGGDEGLGSRLVLFPRESAKSIAIAIDISRTALKRAEMRIHFFPIDSDPLTEFLFVCLFRYHGAAAA